MAEEKDADLRKLILLEEENLRVNKERLAEARRARMAARTRVKLLEEILAKYASQSEQLQILSTLPNLETQSEVLREWFEHLSERIDSIESLIYLIVGHLSAQTDRSRLQNEVVAYQRRAHLERLRSQYQKDLDYLQEQAAKYGAANVPLHLQNEIEHRRSALADTEEQLND